MDFSYLGVRSFVHGGKVVTGRLLRVRDAASGPYWLFVTGGMEAGGYSTRARVSVREKKLRRKLKRLQSNKERNRGPLGRLWTWAYRDPKMWGLEEELEAVPKPPENFYVVSGSIWELPKGGYTGLWRSLKKAYGCCRRVVDYVRGRRKTPTSAQDELLAKSGELYAAVGKFRYGGAGGSS